MDKDRIKGSAQQAKGKVKRGCGQADGRCQARERGQSG